MLTRRKRRHLEDMKLPSQSQHAFVETPESQKNASLSYNPCLQFDHHHAVLSIPSQNLEIGVVDIMEFHMASFLQGLDSMHFIFQNSFILDYVSF